MGDLWWHLEPRAWRHEKSAALMELRILVLDVDTKDAQTFITYRGCYASPA